jgi:hypothetical protein
LPHDRFDPTEKPEGLLMQIVRPVVSTVGGVGGRFRDLARLNTVARILIRHGLGILVAGIDLPGLPKVEAILSTTPLIRPPKGLSVVQDAGRSPSHDLRMSEWSGTRRDALANGRG